MAGFYAEIKATFFCCKPLPLDGLLARRFILSFLCTVFKPVWPFLLIFPLFKMNRPFLSASDSLSINAFGVTNP